MSFIAELRQRKVLRVAAVYLAMAWVATEVASVALPAFDAPAWALRVIILLFALGFPLVLLLTWALEVTPQGIKATAGKVGNKRMAVIAAGFLALALAWYFVGQPAYRKAETQTAERSIAVLPFVNMSGDQANDYFSDGLAETTLDMLAQVSDLKVIARTSSFAFKGKADDVRQIGKALGAAHLLEGSVQQAGDTVRITAQLVRTSDGSHLWSRRFDRKLSDVFKIQDEIATEVVKALQVALPAAEQEQLLRKRTDNVAAYKEYLKGNALLPGRKIPEMRQALTHFESAIQLDPDYARAYAMAGTTLSLLGTYSSTSDAQRQRQAQYIERALELAPNLGEAYIAQGAMFESRNQLPEAERAYRRGVELAPGYATGYQWLGEFLLEQIGNVQQALPLLEHARALDPLSPIIHKEYVQGLLETGRIRDAQAELERLMRAHPDFAPAFEVQAELSVQQGDLAGALRAYDVARQLDPESGFVLMDRCRLQLSFGARADATACLSRYRQAHPGDARIQEGEMMLLVADGKLERALAVNKAMKQKNEFRHAGILMELGRHQEAETILRELVPELFLPQPDTTSQYLDDLLFVGELRMKIGDATGGRALLGEAVRRAAARPPGSARFARQWTDVIGLTLLGRPEQACAALRASVEAGMITDWWYLESSPNLGQLRASPCFERAIAPARARAAAKVEEARKAGLL